MAKKKNTDFFSSLRSAGLRKGVAKTLADLEKGGKKTGSKAEQLARQAVKDLRAAADAIEKRLKVGVAGTRTAAKKATKTRKRTTARKTTARKTAARKTTARKTTARKTTARKTTARKAPARRTTARKRATPRKSAS
jgi:hypothetical protein